MLKWIGRGLYVLLLAALTALTQVGGAVLLMSTVLVWSIFPSGLLSRFTAFLFHVAIFIALYVGVSFLLVPEVARTQGRVQLQCTPTEGKPYGALSPVYCILNRNYVAPHVEVALGEMATALTRTRPGTVLSYLDAGFPFLDRFPMLPHISHREGRDVDLAFFYTDENGIYLPGKARSPVGYWGFEQPPADVELPCAGETDPLTLRWDMRELQAHWPPYRLDEARTGDLLRWLTTVGPEHGVAGLIIEPHLAARLGVNSDLIRFQGCKAARHDDHIHIDFN